MDGDLGDTETTLAIVAHSLLASMTVIRSGLATVVQHADRIERDQADEILRRAHEQAVFVADILSDLVRGLPPDAETLLRPRSRAGY